MKRRAKITKCKNFKPASNVFGICKSPNKTGGCTHEFLDQCVHSDRKYKIKSQIPE